MKENEEATFYVCWAPGVVLATTRNVTLDKSKAEAVSLSRKHGLPVYVLKSIGIAVPHEPPVEWLDTKENT